MLTGATATTVRCPVAGARIDRSPMSFLNIEEKRVCAVHDQLPVAAANGLCGRCRRAPEERAIDLRRLAFENREEVDPFERASAGTGAPVAARIDAVRSIVMPTWSTPFPPGIRPGHRTIAGTRMPPSHTVHLRLKSGPLFDSHSPPLSFVKMTMVLLARPSRSSVAQDLARRRGPPARPSPRSRRACRAASLRHQVARVARAPEGLVRAAGTASAARCRRRR